MSRIFFILVVLLAVVSSVVRADDGPVLPVSGQESRLDLGTCLYVYKDTSARLLSIQSLLHTPGRFYPNPSPVPNFGVTAGRSTEPIWLRFKLRNTTGRPLHLLTEVHFWYFDEISFYLADGDRVVYQSRVLGWRVPVERRIVQNRNFVFPFTLPPHAEQTAFVRVVKRRGARIVPIAVRTQAAYERYVMADYGFWGGIFCTLTFISLMSLCFYITSLDRLYGKYALCLLGILGFFWINAGFMNQFAFGLQSMMPERNISFMFPLLLFYTQLLFTRSFLSLRYTAHYRWHQVSTVVLVLGAICTLVLNVEHIVQLTNSQQRALLNFFSLCYWLPMPLIVVYAIINIHYQYQPRAAWLYLVAFIPFHALNFMQVLSNFQFIRMPALIEDYRGFALAALFEVIVLTLGLAYRYKSMRDGNERLTAERNEQQRLAYEAEVQALALKNSLLLEKSRIARDLHDNVGAHLAFVVTNLTHISDQAEKQPIMNGRQWAGQLRTIVDYTREAIKLLRETIWAIHQENFTVEEFAERLNQHIDRYFQETNGLRVDVVITGSQSQRLTSGQVLNLFRIVQEALNNVVKHAQASQASVLLQVQPGGQISLRIHDNGRGFGYASIHAGNAVAEKHYGLQNMQTRARELGGTFRVFAEDGTTVEVEVG